jgi:hypothetical protein
MIADVFMDRRFHLQLPRADLAMSSSIFFMDELDGKDGIIGIRGTRFLDTGQRISEN